LAIVEIAKLIAEEWHMLSEAQKEVYKAQSLEEKANYQIKCENARRLYKGAAPATVDKKPAKQVEKKVLTKQGSSSSLSSVQSDDAGIYLVLLI
jgi:hypothetical protein